VVEYGAKALVNTVRLPTGLPFGLPETPGGHGFSGEMVRDLMVAWVERYIAGQIGRRKHPNAL
jgi:hypothetical protein